MRWAALFFALPLFATTIVIQCGSADDPGVGGIAATAAGVSFRYDAFQTGITYRIAATGPQVVTLRFLEPSVTAPGLRLFSVVINNQPVISSIDLYAEAAGKPTARTMLAWPADGFLSIVFTTQRRSAVISAIEITPLADFLPGGTLTAVDCQALCVTQ